MGFLSKPACLGLAVTIGPSLRPPTLWKWGLFFVASRFLPKKKGAQKAPLKNFFDPTVKI
jgi:hypothetical protein